MDAFLLLSAVAFAALALLARRVERDALVAGSTPGGAAGDLPPMRLALLGLSPAQFAAFGPERAEEAAHVAAAAMRQPASFSPLAPAPAAAA